MTLLASYMLVKVFTLRIPIQFRSRNGCFSVRVNRSALAFVRKHGAKKYHGVALVQSYPTYAKTSLFVMLHQGQIRDFSKGGGVRVTVKY